MGVLIETMRREGFDFQVSRPRVLFQKDEKGGVTRPAEDHLHDVDGFTGVVVDKVSQRKGEMTDMRRHRAAAKIRITFIAPRAA